MDGFVVVEADAEIADETCAEIVGFLNAPGHCPRCKGTKRVRQAGFDGWEWVPCWDCTGLVA